MFLVFLFLLLAAAASDGAPGPGRDRAKVASIRSGGHRAAATHPSPGGDLGPHALAACEESCWTPDAGADVAITGGAALPSRHPAPSPPSRAPPARG